MPKFERKFILLNRSITTYILTNFLNQKIIIFYNKLRLKVELPCSKIQFPHTYQMKIPNFFLNPEKIKLQFMKSLLNFLLKK